jgi:hypothetical protein
LNNVSLLILPPYSAKGGENRGEGKVIIKLKMKNIYQKRAVIAITFYDLPPALCQFSCKFIKIGKKEAGRS